MSQYSAKAGVPEQGQRSSSPAKATSYSTSGFQSQQSAYGVWGRKTKADSTLGALVAITCCPIWITLNWIALELSHGSLLDALDLVSSTIRKGGSTTLLSLLPKPSWNGVLIYTGWVLFQAFLFQFWPGKLSYGQKTPGGHLLTYKTNGLSVYILSHLLFFVGVHQGWWDAAVIAHNWQGLVVAANVYGYLLALLMKVKAHYMPSFPSDNKLSGSWAHDFWMGIELNPRLGQSFDLKLFHNGRPGIVAWTLIDISFAAHQYELHGYVSNSSVIVLVLHAIYVLDFFANEDWYLRTMDIAHDHFGMMLCWGDVVFLPTFYTLQAQYTARFPVQLNSFQLVLLLSIGFTGYYAFRSANEEKDRARQMNGATQIWGRPATYIRCTYHTTDGKEHESILLTSGWWGVCRHANYTADLLMAFAMCAACGTLSHLLPWSYFIYLCVLLTHRTWRDEARCQAKYGAKWDEFCRAVPWRLVPGIY